MASPDNNTNNTTEIRKRIGSALILIPPVIAAIYLGTPYFEILMAVAGIILAVEWGKLCKHQFLWMVFGIVYILPPVFSLIYLRRLEDTGASVLLWLFILVWAADSGAYFFGRLIGGPKLAPRISPKKTWAGFIGGVMMSGVVGWVFATYLQGNTASFITLTIVSAVTGAVSQCGDLLESALKRHFNVKDSGSLIPGHGGLLDRVDGLLIASLFVSIISLSRNESIPGWM